MINACNESLSILRIYEALNLWRRYSTNRTQMYTPVPIMAEITKRSKGIKTPASKNPSPSLRNHLTCWSVVVLPFAHAFFPV